LLHKIESAEADSRLPAGYLLGEQRPACGHNGSLGNGSKAAPAGQGPPAKRAAGEPPEEPVLVQLATVQPLPVRWLWPGWLPEGSLCVLDGDPGLGKSSMTLDLAARITTARAFPPFKGPDLGRKPGGVLLMGAEDSLAHTVRPRLDAAGGDSERIWSFEAVRRGDNDRLPVLPDDIELLVDCIRERAVKLLVIDPFVAFLGGEYDAHRDQDVRRCLRPLARLAAELDIVVLLLRHLNKLAGGPALYRGGSSIGITGAARASLIVGRDPEQDRFVLAMNKCNLAPKPLSLAYHLEASGLGCRVVWEESIDLRADQILGHGNPARPRGRPADAGDEARRWLADLLCGGPVAATEILERAKKADIVPKTLQRAKDSLSVRSFRQGEAWFWELPGQNGASPDTTTPFDEEPLPD
jgi:hypothetical protein